jgi:hypothetical protein
MGLQGFFDDQNINMTLSFLTFGAKKASRG